jgi:hypothetical protein
MFRAIASIVLAAWVAALSAKTPAASPPRLVQLNGHAFADENSPYLAGGASLVWGGWGCLHDRSRFERNLAFLAGKVDFIRVLAVVGPGGWRDRAAPAADLEAAIACVSDRATRQGLRIEWTIFGSIETAPTRTDRIAVVRRFAAAIRSRASTVQLVEVANEAWQNGFAGDAGREEARNLARVLRDLTPIRAVAITAPQPGGERVDTKRWYEGSAATLVTIHPDRDQTGAGGKWRPVTEIWKAHLTTALPWIANEPIGPQSSVVEDDDPRRLATMAGMTWLSGGAAFTVHTGAGVRGGGAEDRARGRAANIWEVPRIEQTLAGINAMRSILPKDLPNFRPLDPTVDATDYPFESAAVRDRIADGRLLAAYAALAADGRFVVMPLLATASVPLTAKFTMQLTLFDPATGARVETRTLAAGETFTLSPRDASVIVGARHSR